MKYLINIKVIFLSLLALYLSANESFALIEVPTFRMGLGMSMLNFTAGTLYADSTPLGSKITINPMFLWDIPNVRSRVGLNFLAEIGSSYGSLPISGVGLTGIFYPLGLSSSREVNEDSSIIIKHRISPYLEFQVTPVKCSISDATKFGKITSISSYFSALIVETSVGLGLDYPVSEDLIAFAGLHYRFAAFTSEETTTGAIKYNGIQLLLGVMTNFF